MYDINKRKFQTQNQQTDSNNKVFVFIYFCFPCMSKSIDQILLNWYRRSICSFYGVFRALLWTEMKIPNVRFFDLCSNVQSKNHQEYVTKSTNSNIIFTKHDIIWFSEKYDVFHIKFQQFLNMLERCFNCFGNPTPFNLTKLN